MIPMRNVWLYCFLAYAISWLIGVPLALIHQGLLPPILPFWTHYLIGYGPLLAAVIITGATQGADGLRRLARQVLMWRVRPIWWLVACSPFLIALCLSLALIVVRGPFGPSMAGNVNFLGYLGIGALPFWFLTFGIGEETGWRGYLLPRLQQRWSAFTSTIILTIIWAGWHLPQFFYVLNPAVAIGWVLGLFAGAIIFTWIFNSSGGSVLIAAVFHGCFNFISASTEMLLAASLSVIVMVWALVLVVWRKPTNLSAHPRITA